VCRCRCSCFCRCSCSRHCSPAFHPPSFSFLHSPIPLTRTHSRSPLLPTVCTHPPLFTFSHSTLPLTFVCVCSHSAALVRVRPSCPPCVHVCGCSCCCWCLHHRCSPVFRIRLHLYAPASTHACRSSWLTPATRSRPFGLCSRSFVCPLMIPNTLLCLFGLGLALVWARLCSSMLVSARWCQIHS
jgi:hypothetical protein